MQVWSSELNVFVEDKVRYVEFSIDFPPHSNSTEIDITNVLGSSLIWTCQILYICFDFFHNNKYSILKIRPVQIDELPKTLLMHRKFLIPSWNLQTLTYKHNRLHSQMHILLWHFHLFVCIHLWMKTKKIVAKFSILRFSCLYKMKMKEEKYFTFCSRFHS